MKQDMNQEIDKIIKTRKALDVSMVIDKNILSKVWDILVNVCGAWDDEEGYEKFNFIYNHLMDDCGEWRFQGGDLGFGGKFRFNSFTVDCYSEDMNDKRIAIIRKANAELRKLL